MKWLRKFTDDSIRAVAKKAGLTPRTLDYQLNKGTLSPESVIAVAEAYGVHPVGALVDTNYLNEKWAQQVDPARALRSVTEDELANEVLRRMKLGTANNALATPIDELVQRRKPQQKFDPHEAEKLENEYTSEELLLIEQGHAPDIHTLHDLHTWRQQRQEILYAADSSPDEDTLFYESGEDPID